MELISSRFCLKGELATGVAPILRRVGRTLHTKLLQFVHGYQSLCRPQGRSAREGAARTGSLEKHSSCRRAYVSADAVHGVVVFFAALAIDTEFTTNPPPRAAGNTRTLLGGLRHHSRR